jgi:hypothetical protein
MPSLVIDLVADQVARPQNHDISDELLFESQWDENKGCKWILECEWRRNGRSGLLPHLAARYVRVGLVFETVCLTRVFWGL